eukprot:12837461-Alexandrium_andersonii.AAC.1
MNRPSLTAPACLGSPPRRPAKRARNRQPCAARSVPSLRPRAARHSAPRARLLNRTAQRISCNWAWSRPCAKRRARSAA